MSLLSQSFSILFVELQRSLLSFKGEIPFLLADYIWTHLLSSLEHVTCGFPNHLTDRGFVMNKWNMVIHLIISLLLLYGLHLGLNQMSRAD